MLFISVTSFSMIVAMTNFCLGTPPVCRLINDVVSVPLSLVRLLVSSG